MKIFSWNVNGLRAIIKKRFYDIIAEQDPDIICLQEIKANKDQVQLDPEFNETYPYQIWNSAERKGYSGTAIFSKIPFKEDNKDNKEWLDDTIVHDGDTEGRLALAKFSDFTLLNLYNINAKEDLSRLDYKTKEWNSMLIDKVNYFNADNTSIIICGDFNVAHKDIDIWQPKGKEKRPGATLAEKGAHDDLLKKGNLVDCFRMLNPDVQKYSWWCNYNRCRENNKGWRIDSFLCSKSFVDNIKNCDILDQVMGSDHAPLILEC